VLSDGELKRRVEAALGAHPAIESAHIPVQASGGSDHARGFVRCYGHEALAEFESERVLGALGVANDIVVRLPEVDRRSDPDIALDAVAAIRRYLPCAAEHITVTVHDGSIVLEDVVEWNT
jgi:osmotically-inducible protein OsmY